jgi:hypothetical protein
MRRENLKNVKEDGRVIFKRILNNLASISWTPAMKLRAAQKAGLC